MFKEQFYNNRHAIPRAGHAQNARESLARNSKTAHRARGLKTERAGLFHVNVGLALLLDNFLS